MKVNHLWWIAGSLAGLLLLAVVLYVSFYNILEDQRTEGLSESIEMVESEENAGVEQTYTFHGNFPVHILYATKNERSMIYYINAEEGTIVDSIARSDQMDSGKVQSNWKDNCGSCTFTHMQPAYKNNQPLWEITFTDAEGRYALAYYHMESGEEYQRFAFKKNE